MTFPPIPIDFSQVSQWLIMPSVLTLFANLVISALPKKIDNANEISLIRLSTFAVIGLVSFGLTKLAPDFVVAIEPLWAILAGVIASYYGTQAVKGIAQGIRLLSLRLALGRDAAKIYFDRDLARG